MQNANTWLENAKEVLAQHIFCEEELAGKCHISYGFPSKGALATKKRSVGEAWQQRGVEAIFISPTTFKENNCIEVLGVLCHELIHVSIGVDKGHRNGFKAVMNKIGLEGKPTATIVGDELAQRLNALKSSFGDMPQMLLDTTPKKKPGSRMIKLVCGCERILRVSQKVLDEGTINCGVCQKDFCEVQKS